MPIKCSISEILEVCTAIPGGIYRVQLLPKSELTTVYATTIFPIVWQNDPTPQAGESFTDLGYKRKTAELVIRKDTGEQGDYTITTLKCYVKQYRIEVQRLIRILHNRPVSAIITDSLGNRLFLQHLRLKPSMSIEGLRKGKNGYELVFGGSSKHMPSMLMPINIGSGLVTSPESWQEVSLDAWLEP